MIVLLPAARRAQDGDRLPRLDFERNALEHILLRADVAEMYIAKFDAPAHVLFVIRRAFRAVAVRQRHGVGLLRDIVGRVQHLEEALAGGRGAREQL